MSWMRIWGWVKSLTKPGCELGIRTPDASDAIFLMPLQGGQVARVLLSN